MKKLRLDPEALEVDAFEIPAPGDRGTVAGRDSDESETDAEWYTCYEDCTTRGEDLSCMAGCPALTIKAYTCPDHTIEAV